MSQEEKRVRTDFTRAFNLMGATNDAVYEKSSSFLSSQRTITRDYTKEEIEAAIKSGTSTKQRTISRAFFNREGIYKRVILYYATLLRHEGILFPHTKTNRSITDSFISRRYYGALDFTERIPIKKMLFDISLSVLLDGAYYGVITELTKDKLKLLRLPFDWCRTRFEDSNGVDLVEFNVKYFTTFLLDQDRDDALALYPKEVVDHYHKYKKGKVGSWVFLNSDYSVYFSLGGGQPLFLNILPTLYDYQDAIERNAKKEIESLKRILVQKIPSHFNSQTGETALLFEPDEAAEMHSGAVKMIGNSNPDTAVLTTYADISSEVINTGTESQKTNSIDTMGKGVYRAGGVSPQLFAAEGNLALSSSISKDMSTMMILENQFSLFLTNLLNKLFANNNIRFKYSLFALSYQNQDKFIADALKMASSGYSAIVPALAMGMSQRDLVAIKELENDELGLVDLLIPLKSSHTQSGDEGDKGRKALANEEKSEKTIKNIEGGSQ